jgi:sulfite exporter TauE/SafE/copper chaperone CopZ
MKQNETAKILTIGGMTCPGCELRIENALQEIPGIIRAEAKYTDGRVYITYDSSKTEWEAIIKTIQSLDYEVTNIADPGHMVRTPPKYKGIIIAFLAFAALGVIVLLIDSRIGFNAYSLRRGAGYGVLFIVGLISSMHCLFMCGSINLAVCTSYQAGRNEQFSKIQPSLLYNAGRVVTCTLVGGIAGGIGSVIALAPGARGIVSIMVGVFMVLMGLTMLNLFPALRGIMPGMPKFLGGRVYREIGKSGPLVVGLLNGFMPCGVLQSIQIYALGTGNMLTGALSMFFFSIGTVPLMFGFGALSSALSERFTSKMMKIGAVMIMVMGLMMLVRGMG